MLICFLASFSCYMLVYELHLHCTSNESGGQVKIFACSMVIFVLFAGNSMEPCIYTFHTLNADISYYIE